MAANTAPGVPSRLRTLYVSFGLSQASSSAVDTLILLFAAKVLFASEKHIALLDAVGYFANTIACILFSLLWQYAPSKRIFTSLGFFAMGIPIFLFSSIGTLWMAYTLTIIFEALMILPAAVTASYLSSTHSRAELPSAYGKLGASGFLGSAVGLLLAIGWLAIASHLETRSAGERTLFAVMGMLAVISAAGAWRATVALSASESPLSLRQRLHSALSVLRSWRHNLHPPTPAHAKPLREPLLSDSMKMFLLLTTFLNVGLGMSFTGTLLYMIGDLKVASSIALLAVLVFRIAGSLASSPAGNHVNPLMPLRFQQIAASWRFLAVAGLALIALIPTGPWGIMAILPLLAACGVSGGIIGVAGPVAASAMVATNRQPRAYLLFLAVSNGGAGIGAWLASLAAPSLGFPALLAVSALVFGTVLLLWHRL